MVKDGQGNVLAGTQAVVPVSTEMNCQNCHGDNGTAAPSIATGKVKQNILTLHDRNEGTSLMASRPVLCAGCHSSNALGTAGRPGLPSLSSAIHSRHAGMDDGTMEGTCYQCHPGPRDQMPARGDVPGGLHLSRLPRRHGPGRQPAAPSLDR